MVRSVTGSVVRPVGISLVGSEAGPVMHGASSMAGSVGNTVTESLSVFMARSWRDPRRVLALHSDSVASCWDRD